MAAFAKVELQVETGVASPVTPAVSLIVGGFVQQVLAVPSQTEPVPCVVRDLVFGSLAALAWSAL